MKLRILSSQYLLLFSILFITSACTSLPTPTPFIPPTAQPPLIEPTLIIQPTQPVQVVQSTAVPTIIVPTATTNPADCINNLTFVADLTVEDGTFFSYGAIINKQWAVQNSGTCNWDSRYRLRFIGGAQLGAPDEIPLYPAKAGTQATIQISFSAPFADGKYESAWQAIDPNGLPFGDPIFMRIEAIAP